ncbi:hypothetical protein [Companilactobacillus sp. HBUAS56257]|jgi:hypothetical protein|uniref:hypothetical protein n=1 Tax=Companilactobacillus sp. HBUAS56257 TaxID=3109360 RepID=UPI002FF31A20
MNSKKIFDDLLNKAESVSLEDLMNETLNETDPEKKKVLNSLYTYVLDKKQDEVIRRKDFIR